MSRSITSLGLAEAETGGTAEVPVLVVVAGPTDDPIVIPEVGGGPPDPAGAGSLILEERKALRETGQGKGFEFDYGGVWG